MSTDLHLEPMRPDEIAAMVGSGIAAYADELIASGVDPGVAAEQAHASYHDDLPGGEPAAGHLAFALREDGRLVGWLWLGPADGAGPGAWWVNDIEVVASERGRGLGRALMELAEVEVRVRGGTSLGLNVFGPNHAARGLYESLGYETTSIRMRKEIEPAGHEPA